MIFSSETVAGPLLPARDGLFSMLAEEAAGCIDLEELEMLTSCEVDLGIGFLDLFIGGGAEGS